MIRNINTITQAEFDIFEMHIKKWEYSMPEGNQLLAIVKEWINERQPTCFSCKGNFKEMKSEFVNWFLFNKEAFITVLNKPIQVEEPIQEAKVVTKKKYKNDK